MTNISDLIKAWKESGSNLSFLDWKSRQQQSGQEEEQEIDNTIPTIDNAAETPTSEQYPTKQPIRWATSGETGQKVRVKNWDEYHVNRHLYISKRNYERLKKEKDTISSKVDKIITKYFEDKDSGKINEEEVQEDV